MELPNTDTQCLKSGDTIFVTGSGGQMNAERGAVGLFHEGTRYLSRWELTLAGRAPVPLRASTDWDAVELSVDATCLPEGGFATGDLHLARELVLEPGFLYERIRVANQTPREIRVELALEFDSDFSDLFEVRGNRRAHRGKFMSELLGNEGVALGYEGLDHLRRTLRIVFDTPPDELSRARASFDFLLQPREMREIKVSLLCTAGTSPLRLDAWPHFETLRDEALQRRRSRTPDLKVTSSDVAIQSAFHCARTDLAMLISDLPTGPYPLAGIPWFATPFGRDGIITALQNLWWHPQLSVGVLQFLASRQGTEDDPARDNEPGKILHEERLGEMAALGEVPYGRYYGSVDSTPLFVLLAGRYFKRTGDAALIEKLWPNLNAAMSWIENSGDEDGDGFVEYGRRSKDGLIQQGWKDSHDSVFYADGELVRGPVALCEVQAYVFEAYVSMAEMARRFDLSKSSMWERKAASLQASFDKHFWDEELGTYCLALDGDKQPCRVRASNAGHCLFTGIALPERAARLRDELLSSDMFCGWGVRTLAGNERRYNPISYHNGSVWPHDNSLIAAGFARYGFFDAADQILHGTLALASQRPGFRLPELVCGFSSRRRGGPVPYPSACAPQAWAAGSLWLMLQAALGLDVRQGEVVTESLRLPLNLSYLSLEGLPTSRGRIAIDLERENGSDGISLQVRDLPANASGGAEPIA